MTTVGDEIDGPVVVTELVRVGYNPIRTREIGRLGFN
jgi:hypothetical protein